MTISWQSKFKAEVATLGPSTKSITGNYTAKDWTEVGAMAKCRWKNRNRYYFYRHIGTVKDAIEHSIFDWEYLKWMMANLEQAQALTRYKDGELPTKVKQ